MEPSHWVFQANPKHYDIDRALAALDQIWWRCPQYMTEIHAGDVAVIWRSGDEAGVVGVGRVLSPPQMHAMDDSERPFVLHADESPESATRVLISLRPSSYVSKERIRSIPELAEHRIITAPMGTVFPLSSAEWTALASHLETPPALDSGTAQAALPPVFAWEQRAKGVMPMPGGYDEYLTPAWRICEIVDESRPTSAELAHRIHEEFSVRAKGGRNRESFLRKIGLLRVEGGLVHVGEWARRWMETGDDDVISALLHSRCQFIGEMLAEAKTPRTVDEMLSIVNERYDLAWDTNTQINNRRGWLQSAGHLAMDHDGRLTLTDSGRALLERLEIRAPGERRPEAPKPLPPPAPIPSPSHTEEAPESTVSERLAREVEEASTDSGNPDRFERAVRDAFAFLGFDAEWLGGAGRTDVLIDAPLGKSDSYRVTVDGKTTSRGALGDQQVDWTTLVDHREQHEADYSLLVAPNPSIGRLTERAANHAVAVMSANQLAGLCRQHARSPLGLEEYRALFVEGGLVDTTELDELADDVARLVGLAEAICSTLASECMAFGRLTARDLWLTLARSEVGEGSSEDEIQELLVALSNPLVRAIDGSSDDGYVLATNPKVIQSRLRLIGEALAAVGD